MEKLPITDFEEAILGACDIALFAVNTAKTKHLDILAALALEPSVALGIDGYKNIVPQALDIDSAEAAEVVGKVAAKFATTNEKAKSVIVAAVAALPGNIALVEAILSAKSQ